jgi:DNA-binding NarL/FixJ family response regulator
VSWSTDLRIGRLLWVAKGTVEKHVRSILTKLNLRPTMATGASSP